MSIEQTLVTVLKFKFTDEYNYKSFYILSLMYVYAQIHLRQFLSQKASWGFLNLIFRNLMLLLESTYIQEILTLNFKFAVLVVYFKFKLVTVQPHVEERDMAADQEFCVLECGFIISKYGTQYNLVYTKFKMAII